MTRHPAVRTDLAAPARLEALARTMLLDSPPEEAFDRFTRLLSRVVGAPVALLSLVDDERQFFKSVLGLGEPWASARGTGLSRSFCQHVVATDQVLRVTDARVDPRVAENDAINDLGVIAYLGVPVHGPEGQAIGSLCVIDGEPREWTDEDLTLLSELAEATGEIISMRTAAVERRRASLELSHQLRTGLTGLQLDVADALSEEGAGQGALQRVAQGLATQAAELATALRLLGQTEAGDEVPVDVTGLLATVAASRTSTRRPVVVSAGSFTTTASVVPLTAAVRDVVDLLLPHGPVTLQALPGATTWRVRAEGAGVPADVLQAATARSDGGALSRPSLAERVAQQLGGRLVITGGSPTVVELVLPAR